MLIKERSTSVKSHRVKLSCVVLEELPRIKRKTMILGGSEKLLDLSRARNELTPDSGRSRRAVKE